MKPRKPAALVEKERLAPNRKTSKADVEARKEAEVSLGVKKLTPSPQVLGDPIAYQRWLDLEKLYKNFQYVSSADNNKVSRVAYGYAQEVRLSCEINRIREDLELIGASEDIADAVLPLQKMLIRLQVELSKEEKGLFLDPQSRIAALPIKKKEEKKTSILDFMSAPEPLALVKG